MPSRRSAAGWKESTICVPSKDVIGGVAGVGGGRGEQQGGEGEGESERMAPGWYPIARF